jgi:hypothetical protein
MKFASAASLLLFAGLCFAQDQLGTTVATPIACPKAGLAGASCYALALSCPQVEDYTAYLKVLTPTNPISLVLLGTGGPGPGLYEQYTYGTVTVQQLLANGYAVAQLSFGTPFVSHTKQPVQGWQVNADSAGVRRAACRYATVAAWVKQNLAPTVSFCASGNSAGAALIGYGLAHYEIGAFTTFALLTSGPPFSRLDWACDASQRAATAYCSGAHTGMAVGVTNATNFIDPAYQPAYSAACSNSEINHSTALDSLFLPDSVNSPDAVLNYPTVVEFMYGGLDGSSAIRQGENYRTSIASPTLQACIADASHSMPNALDAAQAIAADLITNCHGQ